MRLARIGYNNVLGYLEGGIDAWKNAGYPLDHSRTISATDFIELLNQGVYSIDVRKPDELLNQGAVKNLLNIELASLESQLTSNPNLFPKNTDIFLMCKSG